MALPKVETPKYKLTLPSTQKQIEFRPFLVKEEKRLMIASETENDNSIIRAVQDVIKECTFGEVNETSPLFDLEYTLLQLRAKSKGEIVNIGFPCKECEKVNYFDVDLTKVEVVNINHNTKNIPLVNNIGIMMKYPEISIAEKIANKKEDLETMFYIIKNCIDYIYDENSIYKDYTDDELNEFLENLTEESFYKIKEFFDEVTKIRTEYKTIYACECGYEDHEFVIYGLNNFLK